MQINRRQFVMQAGILATGAAAAAEERKPRFTISLAEWSLHRTLRSGKMTNLDFPRVAKETYGITGVEYVNQFWMDKAKDKEYLADLKKRTSDLGVRNVLIMCDSEGKLGDPDAAKRTQAVENHYKWVEAAKYLGCHSIRVNAYSDGSAEEQAKLAADGLHRLCEFGDKHGINIIVENHGGNSSNGEWLTGVMKLASHKRVGILPDFGNFYEYDRYKGVTEMMPWAKGVSAKTHDFDASGNCIETDYSKMMKIVEASKYNGFIGIEYEGDKTSEDEGIRLSKKLLERYITP
jgi:sugar phosphate isomerase/epimerase